MSENQDPIAPSIYQSMSGLLLEGLKTLTLANSGAVVAILAFLGPIAAACDLVPNFVGPIKLFVGGLICCVLAFFAAYRAELHVFLQTPSERSETDITKDHPRFWFARITATMCILAVALFVLGAFATLNEYEAFRCKAPVVPPVNTGSQMYSLLRAVG